MDVNNCNNELMVERVEESDVSDDCHEMKLDLNALGSGEYERDDGSDDSDVSPPDTQRSAQSLCFESDIESCASSTTVCSESSVEPLSQCSDPDSQFEPSWCSQYSDFGEGNPSDQHQIFSEGDECTQGTLCGTSPLGSDLEDDDDVSRGTCVAPESGSESDGTEEGSVIERDPPSFEEHEDDNVLVICNRDDVNYQALETAGYETNPQHPWESSDQVPAQAQTIAYVQTLDQGTVQPQFNNDVQYQENHEGHNSDQVNPVKKVSTSWVDLAGLDEGNQGSELQTFVGSEGMQGNYQQPQVYPQPPPSNPENGIPMYGYNPEQNQHYQYIPYPTDTNPSQVYTGNEHVQSPQYQIHSDAYAANGNHSPHVNYYYVNDQGQAYQPMYVQYNYGEQPQQGYEEKAETPQDPNATPPPPPPRKGFTDGQEIDYPVHSLHDVSFGGQSDISEKGFQLICEKEPDFPEIGPHAEELSYPYIYVASAGLLTVLLRGNVAVEMTLDHTIRVVDHDNGAVAASNSDGSSSCVLQRGVRVLQDRTVTEASFYRRRRAYLTTAESYFAVGNLCYRMCGEDLFKTETEFTDLSRDLSVNILYSSRSYGPALIPKYMECAQSAQYTNHRNGGISVFVNGIRIYQSPRYDVEITQGEKFIKMSPRSGSMFLGTQWVEIAVENRGTVKVRRGGHFIYVSKEDFSVTAGSIECGLDRTLHAFIRPVEISSFPLNPNRFLNDPSIHRFRRRRGKRYQAPKVNDEDSLNTTYSDLDNTFENVENIQNEDDQSVGKTLGNIPAENTCKGEAYEVNVDSTSYEDSEYAENTYKDCEYKVNEGCVEDSVENTCKTSSHGNVERSSKDCGDSAQEINAEDAREESEYDKCQEFDCSNGDVPVCVQSEEWHLEQVADCANSPTGECLKDQGTD